MSQKVTPGNEQPLVGGGVKLVKFAKIRKWDSVASTTRVAAVSALHCSHLHISYAASMDTILRLHHAAMFMKVPATGAEQH